MSPRLFVTLAGLVFLLIVASNSMYIVKENERAIKLQFGEVVEPNIAPGLHFMIPWVNSVRKFDARVMLLDVRPGEYLTQGKIRLIVDSFLKWKISDVKTYYTSTSGEQRRAENLMASRVDTGLRNQFGVRDLHDVVSGEREELMIELRRSLSEITEAELGIEVVDVRLKRVDFPQEVSDRVYDRMRSERERLARERRSQGKELAETTRAAADRERTVLLAEAYKKAETLRGEGDAGAASVYAQAYNQNPEFYSFYRSLEAYKITFGGKEDLMVLEPDSEFFKYLKNSKGAK